jgi:hypothetical protein
MGQYSILHLIDAFEGMAPGFEFWLDWPSSGRFVQWEQSTNPFVGRGTISNVVQSPANQLGCAGALAFGGLAADNDGPAAMPNVKSTLDGSTDECWWWAVGTSGPAPFSASGGIPTHANAPTALRAVPRARLWVR